MLPEQSRPSPQEVMPPSESKELEKTFEATLVEIVDAERQHIERVHAIVAERSARDNAPIPAWARKAFALSLLFGAETAEATTLAETDTEEPPASEFVRHDVDLSEEYVGSNAAALDRYDDSQEGGIWTNFTIHSQEKGQVGAVRAQLNMSEILGAVPEGEPVVLDGFISEVKLRQDLAEDSLPNIHDGTWNIAYEDPEGFFASKTYRDTYGNIVVTNISKMTLVVELGSSTESKTYLMRDDYISPSVEFVGKGHGITALNFDLSPSNGSESFAGRVFYTQPEFDQKIVRGVPFSSFGLETKDLDSVTEEQERIVADGLTKVRKLFGDLDTVQGVYVSDDEHANATAFLSKQLIELNVGLFTTLQDNPLALREVVEHEALHHKEFELGLSDSSAFIDLWTMTDPSVISEMDESTFTAGFGGHSADNTREFAASLLNSIDDERWAEQIAEMSPAAQELYRKALDVTAVYLASHEDVPKRAPIHDLLRERLKSLDDHIQDSG